MCAMVDADKRDELNEGLLLVEQESSAKKKLVRRPGEASQPSDGTILDDRYALVRSLGEGGSGKVFEAYDQGCD